MTLEKQLGDFIRSKNLFSKKDRLLLAVSGGVDSVVLCDLLHKAGFPFSIAHCNFKLRGKESDEDEEFVQQLSEKYAVDFYVKHFDTGNYAAQKKVSVQVAARDLRYEWFTNLINEGKGAILVTAHHANDNIETLLMNFFKGTGINGLTGISPKLKKGIWIARPLLFAEKHKLLDYAGQQHLSWREDSSNESDKYTRNYFRNQLIPSLQKIFPQAEENLLDNLKRFEDIAVLYNESVSRSKKLLLFVKDAGTMIPVLKLLKMPAAETVLYEIVKDYGFTPAQVPEIMKLLYAETGKYIANDDFRILRNRKWLMIAKLQETTDNILIEATGTETQFGNQLMKIEQKSGVPEIKAEGNTVQIDAAKIEFPLLLRKWKKGDYFYPLGMKKKKKLSRFFIDQKLSLAEKENAWVLESNKKIIWVVGMRLDERFKISLDTKEYLAVSFYPFEKG